MFQNLRTNSQVFILHKESTPYIEYGSVVSVSAPRAKYPTTPPIGQFPQVEMVVDVTVSVNGQQSNLQGLPAGADIADFGQNGNIVVSCSRDAMNNEIGTMKQKSADILASVDYHRGVMESCDKMLNALNPEFAAKQQQEQKISQLESQIAEMAKGMSELMKFNKMLAEQLGVDPETNKKK